MPAPASQTGCWKDPSGFDSHTVPYPGLLLQHGVGLSCRRMWPGRAEPSTALLPTHISISSSRFLRSQKILSHRHRAAWLILSLSAAGGTAGTFAMRGPASAAAAATASGQGRMPQPAATSPPRDKRNVSCSPAAIHAVPRL